jgi:hypothetical protein
MRSKNEASEKSSILKYSMKYEKFNSTPRGVKVIYEELKKRSKNLICGVCEELKFCFFISIAHIRKSSLSKYNFIQKLKYFILFNSSIYTKKNQILIDKKR